MTDLEQTMEDAMKIPDQGLQLVSAEQPVGSSRPALSLSIKIVAAVWLYFSLTKAIGYAIQFLVASHLMTDAFASPESVGQVHFLSVGYCIYSVLRLVHSIHHLIEDYHRFTASDPSIRSYFAKLLKSYLAFCEADINRKARTYTAYPL